MRARVNRRPAGHVLACRTASSAARSSPAERAPLLLPHGRIVTVDPRGSVMQALAVRDGVTLRHASEKEAEKGP